MINQEMAAYYSNRCGMASLNIEPTEEMFEMIFVLCLKLDKSSYVITSLQTKVEHFNLMPIISCAVIPLQPSIIITCF